MLLLVLFIFVAAAVALAWFLIAHDRGEKEPIYALWLAAGLGLAGAFVAGLIEGKVIPTGSLQPGAAQAALLRSSLEVGSIEELCKFLPLALFIYKQRYFNEHTDGIIYFALAGLGFGLPENILYTEQFGAKTGLARLLMTPLFHAAITGIVGYFLVRRKLAGKSPWLIVGPLVGVMLLHGFYDFGLTSGVAVYASLALLITLGLSVALFALFARATELDQDAGLSVVGHNSFCRSCGWANPQHHLYCTHCGKNA